MKKLTLIPLLFSLFIFSCSPEELPSAEQQNLRGNDISSLHINEDFSTKAILDGNIILKGEKISLLGREEKNLSCTHPDGREEFKLVYYPSEVELCFNKKELVIALKNQGMPLEDALERAQTIFHTAYASSKMMGETAEFISPIEDVPGTEYVTGSIAYFLDEGQCYAGCLPENGPGGVPLPFPTEDEPDPLPDYPTWNCADAEITQVRVLMGSSGDQIPTPDVEQSLPFVILESSCDPDFSTLAQFDLEDIQDILPEVLWTRYISGDLNEREFWNLHQHYIVPTLLQSGRYFSANEIEVGSPCLEMTIAYLNNFDSDVSIFNQIVFIRGEAQIFCSTPLEN